MKIVFEGEFTDLNKRKKGWNGHNYTDEDIAHIKKAYVENVSASKTTPWLKKLAKDLNRQPGNISRSHVTQQDNGQTI